MNTNGLLAALPRHDHELLQPLLELVELPKREILFRSYEEIEYVYFFESGLSSEIATANGGNRVEVGCVGREGLSGHAVLLGVNASPHYSFMQIAGRALRIRSADLRRLMQESVTLRELLLRYVHVFMIQLAASTVADAGFTIDQRLARWLLMCQDRAGNDMPLTHEFLSFMLAVRRSSVTTSLHLLEGEHLIKAKRAHITVLNRKGLIEKAAGSYGLPEDEYKRLIRGASS